MTEERKKPKIRLIPVGEGLDKIVSEIKNCFAEWGHEIFTDSGGAKEPDFGAIITILLSKGKDEIVILATVGEQKIQGSPLDLETFVIRVIDALFDELVPPYIDKTKKERK